VENAEQDNKKLFPRTVSNMVCMINTHVLWGNIVWTVELISSASISYKLSVMPCNVSCGNQTDCWVDSTVMVI
jgi:hypothetical protein